MIQLKWFTKHPNFIEKIKKICNNPISISNTINKTLKYEKEEPKLFMLTLIKKNGCCNREEDIGQNVAIERKNHKSH